MTLDPRERLLAPIARRQEAGEFTDEFEVDVGKLVLDILLFNQVVVNSYRLLELPDLCDAFGFEGLLALLEADAVKFASDFVSFGFRKQTEPFVYEHLRLAPKAQDEHFESSINVVDELPLSPEQRAQLRRILTDHRVRLDEKSGEDALEQSGSDFESNRPTLVVALQGELKRYLGRDVLKNEIRLRLSRMPISFTLITIWFLTWASTWTMRMY